MSFGEGVNLLSWFTKRIDQASKWMKFRNRVKYVKKIKDDVSSDNDSSINDELRKLKQKSEDRKNQ